MSNINWDKRIAARKRRREAELRRNIILLGIGTLVLLFTIVLFASIPTMAAGEHATATVKCYKNICIEYGDTLYSLANQYADDVHYSNANKYIDEVVYMNNLSSPDEIVEGQYLIIPYYAEPVID